MSAAVAFALAALLLALLWSSRHEGRRLYLLGVQHAAEETIRASWRAPDGRIGEREIRDVEQRLTVEARR